MKGIDMERTKTGEFNWVDISAKDFDAQSAFYEGLLGWTFEDVPFGEGQTYRMFYKEGHTVAGMSQLAPELLASGVTTSWNTYLATDDVDATVAKAVELGATVAIPPTDVGDSGRMAAIQDPTGAAIFFWKASTHDETMTYYEPGTLSWNDLNTHDPEKAAAFYSALVGWELESRDEWPMPYWQISVDGQGQAGMMPMPAMVSAKVPSFWMPYFGASDIEADVAKAEELGATVWVKPTEVGGKVSFAVLSDPAGATFALMQPLEAPKA